MGYRARVRGRLVRLDIVVGLVGGAGSNGDGAGGGRGDGALEASGGGGEGDAGRGDASQHASRALGSERGHGAAMSAQLDWLAGVGVVVYLPDDGGLRRLSKSSKLERGGADWLERSDVLPTTRTSAFRQGNLAAKHLDRKPTPSALQLSVTQTLDGPTRQLSNSSSYQSPTTRHHELRYPPSALDAHPPQGEKESSVMAAVAPVLRMLPLLTSVMKIGRLSQGMQPPMNRDHLLEYTDEMHTMRCFGRSGRRATMNWRRAELLPG